MNVNLEARGTGVALTPLLHDAAVSWHSLRQQYGPLLKLVDTVLGVIPNCDRYLEIWPPGFRTYNVLVPNLLNLPVPVLAVGGPPPSAVGLAMYVASRTAGCSYCSAHSCSFALRRGAALDTVTAAVLAGHPSLSRGEAATVAVAHGLASSPSSMTSGQRQELEDVYGHKQAEWVAAGAVLMGFLNTFMDVVGVELEQDVVDEVAQTLGPGWSPGKTGALLDPSAPPRPTPAADGLRTKLRLLPLMPAAIRYDRRWQRGTPSSASDVAGVLRRQTGHDFPVLASLRSGRIRRCIATVLLDNLDPRSSEVGIATKLLAGTVFAAVAQDERLAGDLAALAHAADVPVRRLADAAAFAADNDRIPADDAQQAALLALARAGSSSPARVSEDVATACRDSALSPTSIVELVTWLSVLQLLHRLTAWALPLG